MRNLKVEICYNGTRYHGYQYQINAYTVQEAVEKALAKIMQESVRISGCSRTDTGVHARSYFFSFTTESDIPCGGLVKGMNTLLPNDIAVKACTEEAEEFHARFSSVGKRYIYKIHNGKVRDPFSENLALMYCYGLDDEKLRRCARYFEGTHDFSSFCASASDVEDKTRTIYKTDVRRSGDEVEIEFIGDGFLHNMVRIMVGTMIFYNEDKFDDNYIKSLFEIPDRTRAGKTAAACGLYLDKVYYDETELKNDIGR